MYSNKFRVRLPKRLVLNMANVNVEDYFIKDYKTNYESVSTLDVLLIKYINIIDMININSAGVDLKFVDREEVPIVYEMILMLIHQMKLNRSNPNFNFEALEGLFDLADTLHEKYFERLKKHFYKKTYGNVGGYSEGGVKIENITFKKVSRD